MLGCQPIRILQLGIHQLGVLAAHHYVCRYVCAVCVYVCMYVCAAYNFMLLEVSHFSLKRGLVALICVSDLTEGVNTVNCGGGKGSSWQPNSPARRMGLLTCGLLRFSLKWCHGFSPSLIQN